MTHLDVVLFSEIRRAEDSSQPFLAVFATAALNRLVPESVALCLPLCFQALWLSTEVEGEHFLLDTARLRAHGLPSRTPAGGIQVAHQGDQITWSLPPSYRSILVAHGVPELHVGEHIVFRFDALEMRELVQQCAEELEQAQQEHSCTHVLDGELSSEAAMTYRQSLALAREQFLVAQDDAQQASKGDEPDYPAGGRQKMPLRTRRCFRD